MKIKLIYPIFLLMIAMGGCEQDTLAEPIEIIAPDAQSPDDDADPGNGEEDPGTTDPDNDGEGETPGDPDNEGGQPGSTDPQTVILAGDADGRLVIDGSSGDLATGKSIFIAGGNYTSITIRNVSGTKNKPLVIKNKGVVTVAGNMKTEDLNHVHIVGNGDASTKYGFVFSNFRYSAIDMHGQLNGVVLQNIQFKNSSNYYSITGHGTNKTQTYDGTSNTMTDGFKILNCEFDNVGRISFGGKLENGTDQGYFRNIEIAHNTFINTNSGTVVEFHNVENYDIHHNVVNNVNQTNNNHNGVFFMTGSGKFHHNKLTNYQGNAIRMWVFSRGNSPQTVEIHHNICYNTRKYGAFEIQTFERNIISGKSTYANAKVYNNTVGKMNTSKDWAGQLLDLYNMRGGSLEYYNNLGFELVSDKAITDMIHNMSNASIVKQNNHYASSRVEAINNTTDFKSKIPGVGAH